MSPLYRPELVVVLGDQQRAADVPSPPGSKPSMSPASQPSTRAVHVATPYGPRRWAHSSRKPPSALSARPAAPARRGRGHRPTPRPATARPAARASSAALAVGVASSAIGAPRDVASADRSARSAGAAADRRRRSPPADRVARALGDRRGPRRCTRSPAPTIPARRPGAVTSAAGPTMSPSTAPGLDRRQLARDRRRGSAARRDAPPRRSRAISDSDTIEVSSTITTSCGRRLPRSCAEPAVAAGAPAEQPVQRRRAQGRAARSGTRRRRRAVARPPRGPPPAGAPRPCRSARPGDQRRALAGAPAGRPASVVPCPVRRRRRPRRAHAAAPAARSSGGRAANSRCSRPLGGRVSSPGPARDATAPPRASSGRGTAGCRAGAAVSSRLLLPDRDERAGAQRGEPLRRLPARRAPTGRPARRTRRVAVVADRGQVDEHVPESRAAHGERARRAAPPRRPPRRARPSRSATCTSAADSTPASLNSRSSPVGAERPVGRRTGPPRDLGAATLMRRPDRAGR